MNYFISLFIIILFYTELDSGLDMHVARFKPESLENLCKMTKFSKKELRIMYRGFKQVKVYDLAVKYKLT